MPELAEVEFFRRQWLPGVGRPVTAVACHSAARVFRGCSTPALSISLKNQILTELRAHGKQLLAGFTGGAWLGIHLGMTGELRVESPKFVAGRHDHLILRQTAQTLVFADSRMFGKIRLDLSPDQPPAWWRSLPPAILSPQFTMDRITQELRGRTRSPIKAVLLDQSVFPGIGNWMADEILWRLPMHPAASAHSLSKDDTSRLRQVTRWVARRALATIGTDWSDPPATWLFNHRWTGGNKCPRPACRTPLRRQMTAGRTTCWCPKCQPDPREWGG